MPSQQSTIFISAPSATTLLTIIGVFDLRAFIAIWLASMYFLRVFYELSGYARHNILIGRSK